MSTNPGAKPNLPAFTSIARVIKDRLAPMPSIERRDAIESALIGALYHVRTGDTVQAKHIATGKAVTAARLLKQACAESTSSSGRA